MKSNVAPKPEPEVVTSPVLTHEGGKADPHLDAKTQLLRRAATCLLWENTFYETGSEIATGLAALCRQVAPHYVMEVAKTCRTDLKLRHVPLFLLAQLCDKRADFDGSPFVDTLVDVIQRADEMGEFLAIYAKVYGYTPDKLKGHLPNSVKRGLARAFAKWDAYQLAKWDRDAPVRLRDVMFLTHPKPKDEAQAALWKQLAEQTLPAADTWEVALSGGADKKVVFERLLQERKLGYMALLMNLRNMTQAQVDPALVEQALRQGARRSKALPFRFLTAARFAPAYGQALSDAMLEAVADEPKLPGTTYVVVDVSGSMDAVLSAKSQTTRIEAASGLAILLREVCERARVFTFSVQLVEVPNVRGFALWQGITNSQQHGGTYLGTALDRLRQGVPGAPDRLIVITDEQAHDGVLPAWAPHAYVMNVAPYAPGLQAAANGWTRINGWSERMVTWLRVDEALAATQRHVGVDLARPGQDRTVDALVEPIE